MTKGLWLWGSTNRVITAKDQDPMSPDELQLSAELGEPTPGAITFSVHGPASTKGSTRIVPHPKTGKSITVADTKSLPAWTQAVAWSAKAAGVKKLLKPRAVAVRVWLLFARPTSVRVSERPLMTVKPDLDKCLRATLDALTGIAYEDDSQVVETTVRKRYGARTETYLQIFEIQPHVHTKGGQE